MLQGAIVDKVNPELPDQTGGLSFKLPSAPAEPALPMLQPDVDPKPEGSLFSAFDEGLNKPATWEAKTTPDTFDWDKSNIERYIQNPHFHEAGFDPYAAPVSIDGKTYDANELRYNHLQSTGDVAWNGIVGGGALMLDTAWRQFTQWGDTVKGIADLVTGKGWEKAKRDFVGTDEELMQANKEQQEIMNKYAIYHGEYEDHHLFSKEYLFDNIQQFGLGAGQGLEMLAEVAATWGIGAAFDAVRGASIAAKTAQSAEQAARLGKAAGSISEAVEAAKKAIPEASELMSNAEREEMALKLQQGSDMSLNKPFVDQVWRGFSAIGKTPIPGSGLVGGIGDIGKAYRAGASGWGAWKGGVGTMAKELSLFNMAATHGKLLAFTTFGQQYADLINQYEAEHDGAYPDANELSRIRNNAWMAAGDNFTLNLGLIMAMGKIEWGGLYSKMGSVKTMLRDAETTVAEGAEKNLFTAKGTFVEGATLDGEKQVAGEVGHKAYEKVTGMFPSIRTVNMVRKDFGLGTALWEGAKTFSKSQLAKFEIAEGLHMVLQNTSDRAFREYYKNQYNGGTDINGHSFLNATGNIQWGAEMQKEFSNFDPGGGLKTFIMGATNGLFMTPIHHVGTWANQRIMTKISSDAKDAHEYRKAAVAENLKMMNAWFKDPKNVFNPHIDAIKTSGKAAQGMADGVDQQSKYVFHNNRNDMFAKTVATFIKTGNYKSFLWTLKNMGNMDEKSFYEAFPAMKPAAWAEGQPLPSPATVVDGVAKDVTSYYNRWQKLTDQFSGFIKPEYFEGRASKELKSADKKREENHQQLQNDYSDVKWGKEHEDLADAEKTTNSQKQQEFVDKHNKIENDYQGEIKGNRYAEELMKKRVLDEAIEIMATTDYHIHESVKRMLSVVSQLSDQGKFPGVATHANTVVTTLGDKVATDAQIYHLNDLIKIMETGITGPGSTGGIARDIKKQLEATKKQKDSLLKWRENMHYHTSHDNLTDEEKAKLTEMGSPMPERAQVAENLRSAYEDYINSLNEGIGTREISIGRNEFDTSFELLAQHMNLAKDHKLYMDAFNVLANPKGFNQLHDKIYDAMKYNMFDFYVKQREAIKYFELAQEVKQQMQKAADEEKARKEEEQRKSDEAASFKQVEKLSDMLTNIEGDMKALNDEKSGIEEHIKQGDLRAKEIEADLKAAKELLANPGNATKEVKKEFRRMEQSLRGKLKYLQTNLEPMIARRDAINKAVETFTAIRDHYSRAISELEAKRRPFEAINQLKESDIDQVKALQFTGKNIDTIIEDTKAELEILDGRVHFLQTVVDTTQQAIKDLADFVFFKDFGKAQSTSRRMRRFYDDHFRQAEILKDKFDIYSRALQDARTERNEVLNKYDRLQVTRTSREAVRAMEEEMHYIRTIKATLEESGHDPEPEYHAPEAPIEKEAESSEDTKEPEKTEEEIQAEQKKSEDIANNITDHFSEDVPLTPEAQAELESYPQDIKDQLEAITVTRKLEESEAQKDFARDKTEELIKRAKDEALPVVSYPQYTDVPYVEKRTNGSWGVMNPNHTFTGQSFTFKSEANKAVKDRVMQLHPDAKELSPAKKAIYEERNAELRKIGEAYRKSWEKGPNGEAPASPIPRLNWVREVNQIEKDADRKILDLTNLSPMEKQLKTLDLFKRRLLDSIEDITPKQGEVTEKKYRINKYESGNSFSSKEEAVKSIDRYINAEKMKVERDYTSDDERNFELEQLTEDELYKDSPLLINDKQSKNTRINYSDINSTMPWDPTGRYSDKSLTWPERQAALEEARKSYTEFMLSHTPDEIRNGITIEPIRNGNAGTFYNFTQNTDLRVRGGGFTYKVMYEGKPIFSLMPNGANYEFFVKGKWISTDSPEFKDDTIFDTNEFAKFFNYPTDKPLGISLAKFKADIEKANLLTLHLGEHKLSNDELRDKLSFNISTGINYSNENTLKGPVKKPSSFADIQASGLEFAGVIIDNGILGEKQRYVGGRGSQAEEAAIVEKYPVPTQNKGQYTAAFKLPNGEIKWLELSPVELGETEVNDRIGKVKLILSKINAGEEIGNTDLGNINKILESVFIATNPYKEGVDYFSQKVKLSGRISVDKNGDAQLTIFIKDTYNQPSEKQTAVVNLGKFDAVSDAKDLLSKLNNNLANYGLNHENAPFVRNIVQGSPLDMSRFKEQIDDRDMSTIQKMDTNAHVEKDTAGNVVPNSAITITPSWSYNVKAEPKVIPQVPVKTTEKQIYKKAAPVQNALDGKSRLNRIKNDIAAASDADLLSVVENAFTVLDEKEYDKWQEGLNPADIVTAIGSELAGKDDEQQGNIIIRHLLPKFIDKKLSELTKEAEPVIPSARTMDIVSKELEDAVSRGDMKRVHELDLELRNIAPIVTPLSDIIDEETDNPTTGEPEIPGAEKAGEKGRLSAADRKKVREAEEAERQRILKEQQDKGKAPKYLNPTEHFSQSSIENINKFQLWILKNLPKDLISVKDLGTLTDNMKAGRVTVGQFMTYLDGVNVKGRIETYGNAPFKYHEAFHGVFRLLLNQKQIDNLMTEELTKAPVTQEDLDAFRAKGYDYTGKEMIERYLEERMADKFDSFKTSRKEPSTLLGRFFRMLSDLWNRIKAKLLGSELEGLFYDIERGKYRNRKLQDNQFTDRGYVAESMPVAKAIELGTQTLPNGQIVTRYLPQGVADRLSATIAGQVLSELQKGRGDENVILNRIMDNYRNTLDPIANEDFYNEMAEKNFSTHEEANKWFSKLDDHFQTFDDPKARQALKESVATHLRNYGVKLNLENDALEDFEDKTSNTTENFDRDAFSLGGFGNLNSKVRQFIGSATYTLDHDEFFNPTFADGTPITQSVHVGKVYNGLLRALGNQTDPLSALHNLVSFALDTSDSNPETTHFVKYLFDQAGFDYEAFSNGVDVNDCFEENGSPSLINSIVQGFNQQGLNYLFTGFDSSLTFRTSYANTKDSSYYQVKVWGEHFNSIMNRGMTDANAKPLEDLHGLFTVNKMSTAAIMQGQRIGNTYVDGVLELSKNIKKMTGIDLHPDFLLYSILKNKEADSEDVLDNDQKRFIASHPVTDVIEPSVLMKVVDQLKDSNKDIFSKTTVDNESRNFTDSFLNKWATGNANFDEKVNTLNFKSADKKDRYSYIQQNTIGQLVIGLNDPNWEAQINDPGLLTDIGGNYLVNNKQYQRILQQRKLKLIASDGMREMASVGDEGERAVDKKNADGVTFGKMNSRELMAYILGLYNIEGQPDSVIYRGSRPDFYMAAVPIRVNAEKKSFYSIKLPIIDAITSLRGGGFQMSKEAMPILYSMVEREFSRIRTLSKQLDALPDGQEVQGHERIEGWNTGDKSKMRGLQLYIAKDWFSDELKAEIEASAKDEKFDLGTLKDRIESEVNSHFKEQVEAFAREMEKEGLITKNEDGEYENILAPDYLFNGYGEWSYDKDKDGVIIPETYRFIPSKLTDKVHIRNGKFINNLAQVMMNHFINCTEFNNLLHGDESKMFKNSTDPTKRESSNVGTYNNIRTILKDHNLGIDHPITQIHGLCLNDTEAPTQFGKTAGSIKTDDGMMWITTKGLRYTLFGTCKLDEFKARILDNLLSGKPVSETEFFGGKDKGEVIKGLKDRGAFNSMKLLFADGRVTLKCSAFTLTPELTSIFNEATGQWDIPMINTEEAHDLRIKMEAFENGHRWDGAGSIIKDADGNNAVFHDSTVVYAYPKSVSKTLTRNVANTVADVMHTNFEPLDPKFMGNQLENPSNKLMGTEKSQPDYLITTGHPNLNEPISSHGLNTTVRGAIDAFHEAKYLKMKNDWEGAINTLFTAKDGSRIKLGDKVDLTKVDVNIGAFLDHIRENLEMEGTDAQLLGFMETKDGVPVYNINYPGILPKVTANFFTMLSKGVLQGRVPELSLALVSGARGLGTRVKEVTSVWTQKEVDRYSKDGHTKITQAMVGQPKTWRVITTNEYRANPEKFKNAKTWADKKARTFANLRNGDYIIDDLRHNFPEFKTIGNKEYIKHYVSEYIRPAHYAEEMKGVQSSLEYSFGMRIPSDAKHTMINLKMVDTMPVQLGSVGIFPHELIEIAGPDFDIDKQYIHIHDTYVNDKGKRVAYGTETTPVGQFNEYKQYLSETNKVFKKIVADGIKKDEGRIKAQVDKMNLSQSQSELVKKIIGVTNEKDLLNFGDTDDIQRTDVLMSMNELMRRHGIEAKKAADIEKAIAAVRGKYQVIAMQKLGLPSTVEEFTKAGGEKLNNGVQNNKMLNAKMALLGNKEAVKQQDTPTSTKPIKDIIDKFIDRFKDGKSEYEKQLYAQLTEKNTDINSIAGMVNDRVASKVGVEAIGAVANANMIYSIGFENNLQLRNDDFAITIDGNTYNRFDHSTAVGHPEEVISDSISSMLNLFADQPKDRDASKLGLDTKSAGFATYEMAKGMPKETALLYMIQPATVEYMRKMEQLDGELKTDEEKREFKSNYLKAQIKALKNEGAKVISKFTSDHLVKNIEEGGTDKDIQLTILEDLKKMDTQGTTYFKVNSILKLIQGHDATIEEFDKLTKDLAELGIIITSDGGVRKMNDREWEQLLNSKDAPVVDVRDMFMNNKHFISHYIQSVAQLRTLLPGVFLESTSLFKNMMSAVYSNLRVPFGAEGQNFARKVKYDLIGYMALRAYMNFLKNRGNASDISTLADLDNNLIYARDGRVNQGIVDITENLKRRVQDAGIRNAFLDFLFPNQDYSKTNGLDRVDTNTWTTLSEQQQQSLIESYVDLYANNYRDIDGSVLDTHQAAQSMFNYLLVKDGGQFVSGTFIKFMPPFVFKDFMDRIGEVNDLLSGRSKNYDLFGKGVNHVSMLQDFLKGYTTHAANEYNIKRIRSDSEYVFPDEGSNQLENFQKEYSKLSEDQKAIVDNYDGYKNVVTETENELKINMFNGVRPRPMSGKFNPIERLLRDQNWFYLNKLGFAFAEGKSVEFPYSIRYGKNNDLYTLVNVERRLPGEEHKMGKVSMNQMLSEGEYIPSGVIASYTKDSLRGSRQQFAAGFVLPNIPLTEELEGAPREQRVAAIVSSMQNDLANFDEKYAVVKTFDGIHVYSKDNLNSPLQKTYKNKFEAIKDLVTNKGEQKAGEAALPLAKTSIDWQKELDDMHRNMTTIISKEEFMRQARNAADVFKKAGATEEEILEKLKKCMK